ncbi:MULTISPECIES: hypothetical protein [Clostridioides]|uniref:hypothetical protein n=1 Tax=Clostridioides sp. ZZV14-6345 TaxID=2811496 RepID=UPI001CA5B5BA|nr:hypothetical protein [Clostridioides sp. ZZV14-6345]
MNTEKKNIFEDTSISLRAKGLYGTILFFKDDPCFSKKFLFEHLDVKRHSFRMAWNELKENGYLEVNRVLEKGKFEYQYKLN